MVNKYFNTDSRKVQYLHKYQHHYFADGPVNFNPTGPVEDQTQKLISSTD